MKSFKNIATLIRTKRQASTEKLSQTDLAAILGYSNGQFISNVERGLCSIPLEKSVLIIKTLKITKEELVAALSNDCHDTVSLFVKNDSEELSEVTAGRIIKMMA
jgi:transcriptional regulator with XRE-family HTH domain